MKLTKILQGTVACRVAVDDVTPSPAPPQSDVFVAIQERYQFAAPPEATGLQFPGAQSGQFVFQNGKFSLGDEIHAISQLVMEVNGDVLTSTSTDVADAIMDDLTKFLDERFKYNFSSSLQTRSYVSSVLTQFDAEFEEAVSAVSAVVKIINKARDSNEQSVYLQRLSFGTKGGSRISVPNPFMPQSHLSLIEAAEYVIERRSGSLVADNRYFCSAPLKTEEHLKTLEEIEKALLKK